MRNTIEIVYFSQAQLRDITVYDTKECFLMVRHLQLLFLLLLFKGNVVAEQGVIELIGGSFGSVEIVDTGAVRDSSAAKIEIKTNGTVSKISKKRISFIIFGNDTIFYRNLNSPAGLVSDETNDFFRFGKAGKLWISGSFGFSLMNIRGVKSDQKMLLATPAVRFFPTHDFFLGPRLQWTGVYSGVSSINQVDAGMDLGVLGTGTSAVFYFWTGLLMNVQQYKSELYKLEPTYAYGVTWPIGVGVFIRMNRYLYLQIEPGYHLKVMKNSTGNHFSLSVGIAGSGKKYCVSTLHTLTNIYY